MGSQHNDYMTIEEFRRRANEHILGGWTPILPKQVVALTPIFNDNFDSFAANVAYELRHYIVYRTDAGYFARGLVRATGELAIIHEELRKQKYPTGEKITIAAALYRRSHKVPTSRWMMSIKFGRIHIAPDESEKVVASTAVTAQSDKNLAERVLDWVSQTANEPSWTGDRKKRIGDWAELARKVGYPQFLELWYYNRALVALFVQPQFSHRRKEMTGGHRPPYDGTFQGIPWRIYPFKVIMTECKRRTYADDCYTQVANQLALSEREIFDMINDVYNAMNKLAMINSMDYRPKAMLGAPEVRFGNLAPLLRDLKKQLNDVNSLMGTFTKYTQVQPNLGDIY